MPDPITTDKSIERYDGNGSTVTEYPITLQWADDADLHLLVDGVETGAFTVTPTGFTTAVAVNTGTELILYRATPRTQELPFPNNATPSPADVKSAVNKLTLMIQELARNGEIPVRALTFPITEPTAFDTELPDVASRLGKFFYCNASTGEFELLDLDGLTTLLGESFRGEQGVQGVQGAPYTTDVENDATTARTLALTDINKYIRFTNAGTITITIPVTGTGVGEVDWAEGTELYFRRATGAGAIALSIAGVTVDGSANIAFVGEGQSFCLKNRTGSTWDLI